MDIAVIHILQRHHSTFYYSQVKLYLAPAPTATVQLSTWGLPSLNFKSSSNSSFLSTKVLTHSQKKKKIQVLRIKNFKSLKNQSVHWNLRVECYKIANSQLPIPKR